MVDVASVTGAGVEFDSDAASADSVSMRAGAPLVKGAGDAASDVFDDCSCDGCVFSANFESWLDGRRRMTILDGFFILSDLLVETDGDRVPAMGVDIRVLEGWQRGEGVLADEVKDEAV